MAPKGFHDLPAEVRNSIYRLALQPCRINIVGCYMWPGFTHTAVRGGHLALQRVCRLTRYDTSSMIPTPVLSISGFEPELGSLNVPALHLSRTRTLVIESFAASSIRLSSLTMAMPELKSIDIHFPVKYFSTWELYHWTIMGQQCVYSAIHDASYCQELLENYPQPARGYSPLTKLSALWTADVVRSPSTPKVTARQQSIAFCYNDDYFLDEYCKRCELVLEMGYSMFPTRLQSLKKADSGIEEVEFCEVDKTSHTNRDAMEDLIEREEAEGYISDKRLEAMMTPSWDFLGNSL